ncbi:methyl-accepting chemotaxis protein [Bacillus freudenreichii]|nr:methyl-accepting chemotaxis protein [Bacillus freudenreichii]
MAFLLPREKSVKGFAVLLFIAVLLLKMVTLPIISEANDDETNRLIGEKVMGMAATGALLLNGELGDAHEKIVADGHRDSKEYKEFQEVLKQILDASKATYVYTLIKVDDDMTNLIAEAADEEDADPFGNEYEMEPQFETAFAGEPDHAVHTWDDEDYGTQKSAFAPIYNSKQEIVAILGIDYPIEELQKKDTNELVGEKVMGMASVGALLLNGKLGDTHEKIVANGNRDGSEYKEFQDALKEIHEAVKPTYVYTLIKVSDEMTHIIAESADEDDADEYGTEYEMEPQFETAFAGDPDYAIHTWDDEDYGTQKSAFAPVFNSKNEMVAILGIDFPAPELEEVAEAAVEEEKAEEAAAVSSEQPEEEKRGGSSTIPLIIGAVLIASIIAVIVTRKNKKQS